MYLQLQITAIIKETPDAFTYRFQPVNGAPVAYEAGQFLTFLIELHGVAYRRSYSFSSAPGIDPDIAVTIRRKENGAISRYILDHWKTGDIVTTLQPSGRFTLNEVPDSPFDIFLLGAGSGITPLFSLLKYILHHHQHAHIKLFYSSPTKERTIFHEQLQLLNEQYRDQLHIIYLFSAEGIIRRMSNGLLEPLVKAQTKYATELSQFFVCGPPEYMRMALLTLTFMGYSQQQQHKENFVVDTAPQLARIGTPTDSTIKTVLIKKGNESYELKLPGNKNILSEALAQGITLPYSCKGGVCGSCTARCTQGTIWMALNEVLTEKEIAQGYRLTCTGYAVSETVVIEI
ncbi:flavin reductase family protein [Chitinophaga sancti]|uniref:Iron-sulfur cluster-binding domain-containing protein n=1 Tax=Chitinophaga sancti TaxID=1004 RepID=A0A1K1NRN1_9BACT|nr:iron-sulfur cluster-binding domain-containing protein [Chitinophaga sancti]WQD60128.1 iron-sulfur cluster-binding domain-containing protein [Chitinophaga sancti]WQG87744.1 iron-sulfur cluster-binding domain-containing protein [Chitinophaga sancti]SFW37893.1 ring-1,2-phenylacetyl-CoA epoxidase subunit PaaE [Chitinophaga sancti]